MLGIRWFFSLIFLLRTFKWLPSSFLFFRNPQNLSWACKILLWSESCLHTLHQFLSLSQPSIFSLKGFRPPLVLRADQRVLQFWNFALSLLFVWKISSHIHTPSTPILTHPSKSVHIWSLPRIFYSSPGRLSQEVIEKKVNHELLFLTTFIFIGYIFFCLIFSSLIIMLLLTLS